jgi:predicted small metal-binding protein
MAKPAWNGVQTGVANPLAGDSLTAERTTLIPDDAAPGTPLPAVLVVRCECGFEVRGSADDVVIGIQSHARDNHNMQTTREQVLARARPA